jgi:tight adherence protein C
VSVAVVLAGIAGMAGGVGLLDVAAAVAGRRATRAMTRGDHGRRGRHVAALVRLGRRLGVPAAPPGLEARLAAAGAPASVSVADVMAVKAGGLAVATTAAAPAAAAAPGRLAPLVLAGAAAAGFLLPDLALRRRARRRLTRAGLELADVLDLLRVGVEAGLPTTRALAEVGRRRHGLVAGELLAAAQRIELGVSRAASLEILRERLALPEVAALVAAVHRADHHGAPLGPSLAALAREARVQRAGRVRDRAAAAAPRIQLVVALLLVPAVLLLVAAGLLRGLGA